ncbi:hypothetical protein DL98DRAFT_251750 [Cadophora sp. DSE1049]|nr:hypothetical protein DL98DRAFT_251750 [Cadophora sp. DSE1049]
MVMFMLHPLRLNVFTRQWKTGVSTTCSFLLLLCHPCLTLLARQLGMYCLRFTDSEQIKFGRAAINSTCLVVWGRTQVYRRPPSTSFRISQACPKADRHDTRKVTSQIEFKEFKCSWGFELDWM